MQFGALVVERLFRNKLQRGLLNLFDMRLREQIINNYIEAYNRFDIEGMMIDIDTSIKFQNITDGTTDMVLDGLEAFKKQAYLARDLFSERKQTIRSFKHQADQTEIDIDYRGVLAGDLPNGLKKGTVLNLTGRSIFKFLNGKIVELIDIS